VHEPEDFLRDNEFWHFPRKEFAADTLRRLIEGPTRALTLFAPRRTGKSEFLRYDLGPYAHSKGHRVIYVDFMQSPNPLATILHALKTSRKRDWSWDAARAAVMDLAQSITLPGMKISLRTLQNQPPPDVYLYLDDLLGKIADRRKPVILLFDEVQELGGDRRLQPLVAALRSSLDKHRDGLAIVFTGSSLAGLKAMFSERKAPFFHFASPIDLPRLGNDFVEHTVKIFNKKQSRQIKPQPAIRAFGRLSRNPYLFCSFITYLMHTAKGLNKALEAFIVKKALQSSFPEAWRSMTPIQQAVARALAQGSNKPYSKETRQRLGEWMGEGAPPIHRVQSALQKLSRENIARKWGNTWSLDNEAFAAWVINARPPISPPIRK
ncbi:MAG: hypothetical protein OXU61_03475, partial [Gammaproteobacteria bacterium]|nr:hypothetical protein [Gammaproteobacteria bacterium]